MEPVTSIIVVIAILLYVAKGAKHLSTFVTIELTLIAMLSCVDITRAMGYRSVGLDVVYSLVSMFIILIFIRHVERGTMELQDGDIIAFSAPKFSPITGVDHGEFSHVGIATKGGKVIEAVPGDDVAMNDLYKAYKGRSITVFRVTSVPEQQAELVAIAMSLVGTADYEYRELINAALGKPDDGDIKDGMVCSQLVAAVYNKCGYLLDANEHGFHTPNSIVEGLVKVCSTTV